MPVTQSCGHSGHAGFLSSHTKSRQCHMATGHRLIKPFQHHPHTTCPLFGLVKLHGKWARNAVFSWSAVGVADRVSSALLPLIFLHEWIKTIWKLTLTLTAVVRSLNISLDNVFAFHLYLLINQKMFAGRMCHFFSLALGKKPELYSETCREVMQEILQGSILVSFYEAKTVILSPYQVLSF